MDISRRSQLSFCARKQPMEFDSFRLQILRLVTGTTRQKVARDSLSGTLRVSPHGLFRRLGGLLKCRVVAQLPISCRGDFACLLCLTHFTPQSRISFISLAEARSCGRSTYVLPSIITVEDHVVSVVRDTPKEALPTARICHLLKSLRRVHVCHQGVS